MLAMRRRAIPPAPSGVGVRAGGLSRRNDGQIDKVGWVNIETSAPPKMCRASLSPFRSIVVPGPDPVKDAVTRPDAVRAGRRD